MCLQINFFNIFKITAITVWRIRHRDIIIFSQKVTRYFL